MSFYPIITATFFSQTKVKYTLTPPSLVYTVDCDGPRRVVVTSRHCRGHFHVTHVNNSRRFSFLVFVFVRAPLSLSVHMSTLQLASQPVGSASGAGAAAAAWRTADTTVKEGEVYEGRYLTDDIRCTCCGVYRMYDFED